MVQIFCYRLGSFYANLGSPFFFLFSFADILSLIILYCSFLQCILYTHIGDIVNQTTHLHHHLVSLNHLVYLEMFIVESIFMRFSLFFSLFLSGNNLVQFPARFACFPIDIALQHCFRLVMFELIFLLKWN